MQKAFQAWATVSGLTFREATQWEDPDFDIQFVAGDHGDGSAFDGPGSHASLNFLKRLKKPLNFWTESDSPDFLESCNLNEEIMKIRLDRVQVQMIIHYSD